MAKKWLALCVGIACGAVVWALSIPLVGTREPFDAHPGYYVLAMLLSGIVSALPSPRHWWMAMIGIFVGERVYAFVMLPETRAWLLFGIVVNLLIPTWLPAAAGALGVFLLERWRKARAHGR